MAKTVEEQIVTPALIKAARALLDWDQIELSKKAGVSRKTVSLIQAAEEAPTDPRRVAVLQAIRAALQQEGIEFFFASHVSGEGVRLIRPRPKHRKPRSE